MLGTGISPNLFGEIEGRKTIKDIPAESLISWDMLDEEGNEK